LSLDCRHKSGSVEMEIKTKALQECVLDNLNGFWKLDLKCYAR
jgi:hypothetical protein